jgi:DNA-binding HxlR family transcriptional regulator
MLDQDQIKTATTTVFTTPDEAKEVQTFKKSCEKNQECPVKEVLKFLAGAWTVEIFYHLLEKPLRFGEIQRAIGASPKMLTTRLRELEDWGVVRREIVSSKPVAVYYHLTEFGREFGPVMEAIVAVGDKLLTGRKERKQREQLMAAAATVAGAQ